MDNIRINSKLSCVFIANFPFDMYAIIQIEHYFLKSQHPLRPFFVSPKKILKN